MQNQTQNGCSAKLEATKAPQLKVSKDGVYRAEPYTAEFSVNMGNTHSARQPILAVVEADKDPISGSETTGIILDFNTQENVSHWLYASKKTFAFFVDAKGQQLTNKKKGLVKVTFYRIVEKANGQKVTNMTGLKLNNGQIANRKSIQVLNQPVAVVELPYANPTEWDRMAKEQLATSGSSR